MFDRVRLILALCALVLGAAHLGFGVMLYSQLTLEALWFFGSGLAIVAVALSNLRVSAGGRWSKLLLLLQNVLLFGFFVAAWTVLPAPQVAVGAAIFGMLALVGFYDGTRSNRAA